MTDHPLATAGIVGAAVVGATLLHRATKTAAKVVTIKAAGKAAEGVTRAVRSKKIAAASSPGTPWTGERWMEPCHMKTLRALIVGIGLFSLGSLVDARDARADVVTDMNAKAAELLAPIPETPFTVRAMAIVQVSVHDAVNCDHGKTPAVPREVGAGSGRLGGRRRRVRHAHGLVNLFPDEREKFETECRALLARIPESPAKTAGIALGERAANAILEARKGDGATSTEPYKPATAPGVYVPTIIPVVPQGGSASPG